MTINRFRLFGIGSLTVLSISAAAQLLAQPPGPPGGADDRRGRPPRFELGQVFPPSLLEELNLTPAQEEELDSIRKELKTKLDQLLTPEQKQKIENFRPRVPGGPRGQGVPDGNGPPPPRDPPPGGRGPERRERPPVEQTPAESEKTAHVKLKDLPKGVTRAPVVFSGGHETDPRDGGRPVVLIAAALGVTSDVFRDAFSKVRPARGGNEPEPAQVRQNKSVLMEALAKHGVTNERLDTVSNYYRFPPGRGAIWSNKPAVANALVKDGVVTAYEIVNGGSGYSSTPSVSVPAIKGAVAKVEVTYSKDFESNGSVTGISILSDKPN